MSVEGKTAEPTTRLALIARPGIAIRLLDGNLEEIASGAGRLEYEVPQGLYLALWQSAGQQSQTMVRVGGHEQKLEVSFDPSDTGSDAPKEAGLTEKIALLDAVNKAVKPSARARDSSIVLIVTGEPDALEQAGDLQLRLYNRNEVKMRADPDKSLQFALRPGEQSRCYNVRPGRYHIGFHSILGDHLGQSVPALAGRQTLVFLTVLKTQLVVAEGDKLAHRSSVGIDPEQTTIVTIRGDEDDYRVRERVRLAKLMMFDLANQTHSLTLDVVKVLEDPQTDPLLRLYGVLVALCAGESSCISDRSKDVEAASQSEPISHDTLQRWIGDPVRPGLPTDATCATWALERRLGSDRWAESPAGIPARIETPPMFECSWRWAIEESIANPDAVRGAAVVATARSSGGTAPWLCWRIAASKARFVPVAPITDDLRTLVAEVVERVSQLVGTTPMPNALFKALEAFDPEIQATALQALRLTTNKAKCIDVDPIGELAVSLGLPSQLLRKRLANTKAALEEASILARAADKDKLSSGGSKLASLSAPGLTRSILSKDDPNKGRFGGSSRRAGFSITADFKETASTNWVEVALIVSGSAPDDTEVLFYLHDSFRPSVVSKSLKGSTTMLSVTAWGGFTVGVWIPDRSIELELDLSEIKNAPLILRER